MNTQAMQLVNVWKIYEPSSRVRVEALRGVNLSIKRGEMLAIMGPSGSGKSTLMYIMGCLDRPTKGKVLIKGKDVSKLDDDALSQIRREYIGFVFQAYNLIANLTALENVMLPMAFRGVVGEEAEKKALELLRMVGMEKRANHRPKELSGGEQQRVAIARALANDPEVILADEPTGNLDSKNTEQIMELFEKLNKEKNKTIVVVTHDEAWEEHVERVLRIKDGKIVEEV